MQTTLYQAVIAGVKKRAKPSGYCRVLYDDLILMEMLEVLPYEGKLTSSQVRWNLYTWSIRPGFLLGKHFSTFIYRGKLYIVRVH